MPACISCKLLLSDVIKFWHNNMNKSVLVVPLQWRHNGRDSVSNHQHLDYVLNRLFRCRSKKTAKLRVTGLCEGNSPVTGEFPTQRASDAENVSIWWCHHALVWCGLKGPMCNIRADSRFAPSQWETPLLCNNVSHWLGAYLKSALNRRLT